MTKKYIKITPVEAIQVTPYNYCEVIEFAGGQMEFKDFDYLIKNPTGECYVCEIGIFETTYKEVNDKCL